MFNRIWVNEDVFKSFINEEYEFPVAIREHMGYLIFPEWVTCPNGETYLVHVYKRGRYANQCDLKKVAVLLCDDVYDDDDEYTTEPSFKYACKYIDTMLSPT